VPRRGGGVSNLVDLPPGPNPPAILHAIVEIPRGGQNKYEYDPELEVFRLDRVLYSSTHYPAAYGFVPGTCADDGDPLDILIMSSEPTFTGCLIEARPVGLLRMVDEKGGDEKILAVAVADPRYRQMVRLADVAPHFLREVEHFFRVYKDLEGKTVETFGWEDVESADAVIMASIRAKGTQGQGRTVTS
jgi:inorganic pyrophosphatase